MESRNKQNLDENKQTKLPLNKSKKQKDQQSQISKKPLITPSRLLEKKKGNELNLIDKNQPRIIEFLNTRDFTSNYESKVNLNEPLFEAIPSVITFSDYEALKVKTMLFKLRNRDSVARRVKIIQPETNLFRILQINSNGIEQTQNEFMCPESDLALPGGNKVAPGLEIPFLVRFAPETKTDYSYDLIIVTEREKFVVPIVAIGKKALIDFPDIINFGNSCPVKYKMEKPVMIHNKGEKLTKWELKLPENFFTNVTEGVLEENGTQQLFLSFFPTQKRAYESLGKLIYDGDECEFILKGAGINGDVYLSKNRLTLEETYISLESRATFQIVNNSSVKIDFEWRAFASEKEETERKQAMLQDLQKEEEDKRMLINETLEIEGNLHIVEGEEDEGELLEIDEKELQQRKRKKAELLLERKYKTIRKAIEEDSMIFEDDIFSIQPIRGSIWPNCAMTVTVCFKPRTACRYSHMAYCNISCSDQRLPLTLEGEGLGPKAFLSMNSTAIGDIFVYDKYVVNLYIENKGEIPAKFSLVKNDSVFSNMFTFDVEEGLLEVGQRVNMEIVFHSNRVGEFQEMFRWKLEGSNETLTFLLRGNVRAPKFVFDRKNIEFKVVSYQFEAIQDLNITNTSTVPFTFNLRIPQDGKGPNKEFEIVPPNDTISPNETKRILVKLIPRFKKTYNVTLVVDIVGIGKDMKSIPIMAESDVPRVRVFPEIIDFGEIFLRYTQVKEIELINESKLYARFSVHQISSKFADIGKVSTDLDKGQILPESSLKLSVSLTTCCLRDFEIDLIIEIVSDTPSQNIIKLKGRSIGPIVDFSVKEIDFGDVEVLNRYTRKITLTNRSVIDADFTAITDPRSIFAPVQKHYILKPEQSFDVEVCCVADDQQRFSDVLTFTIKEGEGRHVALKARGVGSTIFCKDLKQVSFMTLFTHRTHIQEVFVENKGRRAQVLKWTRKIETKTTNEKKNAEKIEQKAKEAEETAVFTVYPDSVTLPAKSGINFQFKAVSINTGHIQESFALSSLAGNERKSNVLYVTVVEGDFIRPALSFTSKSINFKYIWQKEIEPDLMTEEVEISCGGPLPINCSLQVEPPFSVNPENFSLLPKKKAILKISFDPRSRKNRLSGKIQEKIIIKHFKHPKVEFFDLSAEFCFPNLQVETDQLNFGTVMNDTTKKIYLSLTNPSIMPVRYFWHFVREKQEQESQISVNLGNSIKLANAPINEVFDILPIRGIIEPLGEEKAEFSYYAVANKAYKISALCRVEGGPDYQVGISAEASDVAYSLNLPKGKNIIDVGDVLLSNRTLRDFEIENTSKVSFEFALHLDPSFPRAKFMNQFINISPMRGKLQTGEKVSIKLKISVAFPGEMQQCLILQIAHFEPEKIFLKGIGFFPSMRIEADRKIDDKLECALSKLDQEIILNEFDSETLTDQKVIEIEKIMIKDHIKNTIGKMIENSDKSNSVRGFQSNTNFRKEKIQDKNIENNKENSNDKDKENLDNNTENKKNQKIEGVQTSEKKEQHSTIHNETNNFKSRLDMKMVEEVILGTYTIDLGTVIAGLKVSKTVKLRNIGKCPVGFNIDVRNFKNNGLTVVYQKTQKVPPGNNSANFTINLSTKKQAKAGQVNFIVPFIVIDGGRYNLDISAFVNVPEIILSTNEFDFGFTMVGQMKRGALRLENLKELPCEWTVSVYSQSLAKRKNNEINELKKPEPDFLVQDIQFNSKKGKKEEPSRFGISPLSGLAGPQGKKILEVYFEPIEAKSYKETYVFTFKDSARRVELTVKGEGVIPQIIFEPTPELVFEPCIPREVLYRTFQITNTSDFDTELILPHMDQLYLEQEMLLKSIEQNTLRLPIGEQKQNQKQEYWKEVSEMAKKGAFNQDIDNQITNLNSLIQFISESGKNQQKERKNPKRNQKNGKLIKNESEEFFEKMTNLQKEFETIENVQKKILDLKSKKDRSVDRDKEKIVKNKLMIEPLNRVNILLNIKNEELQKKVAQYINEEYYKGILDIRELIEWHQNQKTESYKKYEEYINRKKQEFETITNENAKKKNKKGIIEIDINKFFYIPRELMVNLLKERMNSDCYKTGIIISGFSNNLTDIKTTVEIISELTSLNKNSVLEIQNSQQIEDSMIFNQNKTLYEYFIRKLEESKMSEEKKKLMIQNWQKEEDLDSNFDIQSEIFTEIQANLNLIYKIVLPDLSAVGSVNNIQDSIQNNSIIQKDSPQNSVIKDSTQKVSMRDSSVKNSFIIRDSITKELKKSSIRFNNHSEIVHQNSIILFNQNINLIYPQNFIKLTTLLERNIPLPMFTDPESLPLPAIEVSQVFRKSSQIKERRVIKNYQLFTFKDEFGEQIENEEPITDQNCEEKLFTKTRWYLPGKKTLHLCLKFSAEEKGDFNGSLFFELGNLVFNQNLNKPNVFNFKSKTYYPCILTNPSNIFNKRKSKRNQNSTNVNNCYIIEENIFYFGSLLLNRSIEDITIKPAIGNKHSSIFKFTNSSNFQANIKLVLLSQCINDFEESPKLKCQSGVFSVSINESLLNDGQTLEARVWAFPKEIGTFKDTLIVLIENNPSPLMIQLGAEGVFPDASINQKEIKFDRILVGKKYSRSIKIKNEVRIFLNWKFINYDLLKSSGFEIKPAFGILHPLEELELEVTYTAEKQEKKSIQAILETEDSEGLGVKGKELKTLQLEAEGFDISIALSGFTDETSMNLDFGECSVGSKQIKSFNLKNNGPYQVEYFLDIPNKKTALLFEISPKSGILDSTLNQQISLNFKSKQEAFLDGKGKACDLILRILEGNSKELYKETKISLQARSCFSKFSISPSKNINFGPILFSESKTMTFDISNTGLFEFNFDLYDPEDQIKTKEIIERYEASRLDSQNVALKNKKPVVQNKQKDKKNPGSLELGVFTLNPSFGTLAPNSTITIEIIFKGRGNEFYEKKIGIEVLNRDLSDTSCCLYTIFGESCIPSLEVKNFRSIFEEQVVVQSLNSTGISIQSVVNSNVFSIEDNCFYFGSIIPSKFPNGISEKFKLINNGKVPSIVKCEITSKKNAILPPSIYDVTPKKVKINPHQSVYLKLSFKPEIMAVYEANFSAIVENGDQAFQFCRFGFELKGEGTLPTLKIVRQENNQIQIQNEETQTFSLGKVRVGKSKVGLLSVKNQGSIPATAQISLLNNPCFKLTSENERTLMPQEIFSFQYEFSPIVPGKVETKIFLSTLLNPFEKNSMILRGEGVFENLSFEGLESEEEVLNFGDAVFEEVSIKDIAFSKISKKSFFLKNNSDETLRVEINKNNEECIEIRPLISHINSKMSKKVSVWFGKGQTKPLPLQINSEVSVLFEQIEIVNKGSQLIQLKNWDDTKVVKRMITQTEANWINQIKEVKTKYLEDKKTGKPKDPIYPDKPFISETETKIIEITEPVKEPDYSSKQKIMKDKIQISDKKEIKFRVKGKADTPKIICEPQQIFFKTTKMFSTRVFPLTLTNPCSINVNYECEFVNPETGIKNNGFFELSSASGQILKGQKLELLVIFKPNECDEDIGRILFLRIIGGPEYKIELNGDVERPSVHFELEPIIGEKDERVVEINALGINKTFKKFYTINPTSLGFDFIWIGTNNYIKCHTQRGTILPGKRFEMIFEFDPDQKLDDKTEAKFTFSIQSRGINQDFLFKAKIVSPKVFFSRAKIDFGPLLITGRAKEIVLLKNLDPIPYDFCFSKGSLKGESPAFNGSLSIFPMFGVLKPESETEIIVSFEPKSESDFNFNLKCKIKQQKDPLGLNVKGIGYKLHHEIWLKERIVTQGIKHSIDFGEIFVNEQKIIVLFLKNLGDFNLDFVSNKKLPNGLIIKPENGTVKKKDQIQVEITFNPIKPMKLETNINFHIVSGPIYEFELTGKSRFPLVDCSPKIINFGMLPVGNHFIIREKMIDFINRDTKAMLIESDFSKNDYLELKLAPGQVILPPEIKNERLSNKQKPKLKQINQEDKIQIKEGSDLKSSNKLLKTNKKENSKTNSTDEINCLSIPIVLSLKGAGRFREEITFTVDNNLKIKTEVIGEGVPLTLELDDPRDFNSEFKVNNPGFSMKKKISIRNPSKIDTTITFDVIKQLATLLASGISLNPTNLLIPSKSVASFDLIFHPRSRHRQISLPLNYQHIESEETCNLLSISALCLGQEIKLIEDTLNFGMVVINSSLVKKLQVINLGDLSSQYSWDLGFMSTYFSVTPQAGFIAPNEQIFFEFRFAPQSLNDYKTQAKLFITDMGPMNVNLLGKGIKPSEEQTQKLQFEASVRGFSSKIISVKNSGNILTNFKPLISYDSSTIMGFFETQSSIDIPPTSSANLEIFYRPFSRKPQIQTASLFIPLPDGTALVYSLEGKPLPPKEEETINISFEAKKSKKFSIQLKNWIKGQQRIQASFETLDGKDPISVGIVLNASKLIDLAPSAILDYKINIVSLKQGNYSIIARFTNTETEDYLFYGIQLTIGEPTVFKVQELNCTIRDTKQFVLPIENPLPEKIVISSDQIKLPNNYIIVGMKDSLVINPNSEAFLPLIYRPLSELKNLECQIKIINDLLGPSIYGLILNSSKNQNVPTIYFKSVFGADSNKKFSIINFLPKQVNFMIKIEKINEVSTGSSDFFLEANSFPVLPNQDGKGTEGQLNIKYEPSTIGASKAFLTAFNEEAGEFSAYLVGQSTAPMPKGPFKITTKGLTIDFRNPFLESREFVFKLEKTTFVCNLKNPFKIDSKKSVNIMVNFKGGSGDNANGRLIIESKEGISWVFYLQGIN